MLKSPTKGEINRGLKAYTKALMILQKFKMANKIAA